MFRVPRQCNSRPNTNEDWYKARQVLLTWARARATLAQLERRAVDETASPSHQSQETIVRRSGRSTSFALVSLAFISGTMVVGPFDFARADNCRASPNSPAPKGSHWYYHLNRATQQKCWYVRSSEKEAQYPTVQTTSANGATPSTSASSAGPNDGSSHQLEASTDALQDPASNTITNGYALSDANRQPTVAPTVVWPDPPQIVQVAPSVIAGEAIATTESNNYANAVFDTTESVTRNGGQSNKFEIPAAIFPALAIGLVVFGFGVRFLMKNSIGRGAQTVDYTAVTIIPDDDHISLSDTRPAEERSSFEGDNFQSFVSAVSGSGPLEHTIGSIYTASEVRAREARLAQLFDDIYQHLGWDGLKQRPPKQKMAS